MCTLLQCIHYNFQVLKYNLPSSNHEQHKDYQDQKTMRRTDRLTQATGALCCILSIRIMLSATIFVI